jgi:hypothetical protein
MKNLSLQLKVNSVNQSIKFNRFLCKKIHKKKLFCTVSNKRARKKFPSDKDLTIPTTTIQRNNYNIIKSQEKHGK